MTGHDPVEWAVTMPWNTHEENFIAGMVWEKGRKNDAKFISVGHEFILIFARNKSLLREKKVLWREEKPGAREIWEEYSALRAKHGSDDHAIEDALQAWYSSLPKAHPAKKWSRYKRVDSNGPWRDRDISWPGGGGPTYDVPHPKTKKPCKVPESGWRYASPEEMQRQIGLGLVDFRDDHSQPPFCKAHIRPIEAEVGEEDAEGSDDGEEEFATQVRGSYFYKQSQVAVKQLRAIFGGAKVFNNPKDPAELARLFAYVTSNDPGALVLDFFAGSGSTAHAVQDLNLSDGGQRAYILVQLPEPLSADDKEQKEAALFCDRLGKPRNIAELTKERLRRATAQAFPGGGAHGFRVFKLDSSNIRPWDPQSPDIGASLLEATEHLKPGRNEADLLHELCLKLGLSLSSTATTRVLGGKTVHCVADGRLVACLAESIAVEEVEPLAQGLLAWGQSWPKGAEGQLVFRDSAFQDDVAKSNLTAILQQGGLRNVRSI